MFKYALTPSTEAVQEKIRGRYIDGRGWRSVAVVKIGGEQFSVRCSLVAASDKLATPEALKGVNWLVDNFENALKSALLNDKLVYNNTMSILNDKTMMQKDFCDQCFKNGFGNLWIGGYAGGEVEIDLDIKVGGKSIPTQIMWKNGKVSEVANND